MADAAEVHSVCTIAQAYERTLLIAYVSDSPTKPISQNRSVRGRVLIGGNIRGASARWRAVRVEPAESNASRETALDHGDARTARPIGSGRHGDSHQKPPRQWGNRTTYERSLPASVTNAKPGSRAEGGCS